MCWFPARHVQKSRPKCRWLPAAGQGPLKQGIHCLRRKALGRDAGIGSAERGAEAGAKTAKAIEAHAARADEAHAAKADASIDAVINAGANDVTGAGAKIDAHAKIFWQNIAIINWRGAASFGTISPSRNAAHSLFENAVISIRQFSMTKIDTDAEAEAEADADEKAEAEVMEDAVADADVFANAEAGTKA